MIERIHYRYMDVDVGQEESKRVECFRQLCVDYSCLLGFSDKG